MANLACVRGKVLTSRGSGRFPHPAAALRSNDEPPNLTYPNGTRVDYLATGESTNRQFGQELDEFYLRHDNHWV